MNTNLRHTLTRLSLFSLLVGLLCQTPALANNTTTTPDDQPAATTQGQSITTSDGVKLFVEVRGQGKPCLYLHGGPGSGSYWLKKFSGAMLEQRFQMIYLDQRGVARSTSPANHDYSLARMVKDFEEVRSALNIERWYTLGHSFGGVLQMAYAQAHQDAHLGMLMINTTLDLNESLTGSLPKISELLELSSTPILDTSKTPLEQLMPYLGQLRERDLFWKLQYVHQDNERIMNATFNEIPNWNSDFGNQAMGISDYYQNFKPASRHINLPVLFFYGKQDWMIGAEHYKTIQFPQLTLWESPVGHVPFMEDQQGLSNAIDHYLHNIKSR